MEHESEVLGIPTDVIAGQPLIQMNGNRSVLLLGVYQMGEYTQNRIVLQLKHKNIIVMGERLNIQYFRKDEIKINGNIQNISFCR